MEASLRLCNQWLYNDAEKGLQMRILNSSYSGDRIREKSIADLR